MYLSGVKNVHMHENHSEISDKVCELITDEALIMIYKFLGSLINSPRGLSLFLQKNSSDITLSPSPIPDITAITVTSHQFSDKFPVFIYKVFSSPLGCVFS